MESEPESPRKRRHRILEDSIEFFKNLKPDDKLRGSVQLSLSLDNVVKHSMEHGLSPENINDLMKVIVSQQHKLTQAARSKLVKCLIPSPPHAVPQTAAVAAIMAICTKYQAPTNLHSLLVRWLLLVYDHLDGFENLHRLYDVIFTFTSSSLLLPHACHLLFLLTRKVNVKLYKVQQLLEIMRKNGPEPYIIGLLYIYKVFCPHLVTIRLDVRNKVFFKAHDVIWRNTIIDIIGSQDQRQDGQDRCREEIAARRQQGVVEPKAKKQREVVPQPHHDAQEVDQEPVSAVNERPLGKKELIPYHRKDTFRNFLDNLDSIEHPSQIAAALSDTRLQLLLSCNPDPVIMARLSFWIQHVLTFGFRDKNKCDTERFEKLLGMLLTFSQNVQEDLPVVEGFLENFIITWDGKTSAPLIFSLLTTIRPKCYEELESCILEPLHKLFFTSDVYFKCQCLRAFTKLLQNFVLNLLVPNGTFQGQSQHNKKRDDGDSVQAGTDAAGSEEVVSKSINVTEGATRMDTLLDTTAGSAASDAVGEETEEEVVIRKLIKYVDHIAVMGMRMEGDHYLLQHITLDFIHLSCQICQKYSIPVICLPMKVMRRLLLSDCPAALSRLCEIINLFRDAFSKQGDILTSLDRRLRVLRGTRNEFNGLVLDALGMFWQGKMFERRKSGNSYPSIFNSTLPPEVKPHVPEDALTFYRGPAFIGLAYKFLKETQPEDKKLHLAQIKQFRDQFLQFMERENFPEFKELVLRNIKNRRAKGTSHTENVNLDVCGSAS